MRHIGLTCKHHPNLRWTCKSIAYSPGWGYNGARNIFYSGGITEADKFAPECSCPPTDLILSPEEQELQKTQPTHDENGRYLD